MTFTEVILTILHVSEEENSTIAYSGAACNMSSTCYGGVYQGEYTPTEVQYSTVQGSLPGGVHPYRGTVLHCTVTVSVTCHNIRVLYLRERVGW